MLPAVAIKQIVVLDVVRDSKIKKNLIVNR